ncbi:MAG: heavy metal-binding domain-containing protein [Phycisphaerae bacterium]
MRYTISILACLAGLSAFIAVASAQTSPESQPSAAGAPDDARFACPMETHPDESDPAHRGAYFSPEDGKCPWCGMKLKSLDELDWVKARRAAGGAEVAYTCPVHQHVFSKTQADCPRCGQNLEPFKVMYTCPDPKHANEISAQASACSKCGRKLAPYRSVWLAPAVAEQNVPAHPEVAETAAYRCPVHPLAHSDRPGKCPICAADLAPTSERAQAASQPAAPEIPRDARYVCPMEECWQFSRELGDCPVCGMKLKPIDAVAWAKGKLAHAGATPSPGGFVCPMHPRETSFARGTCSICGMQLVAAHSVPRPAGAPAVIAVQVDYLMEHYLAIQKRFASDSGKEVALHALGLVGAADEILTHLDDPASKLPSKFGQAVRTLRAAALKLSGKSLDDDRVTFVGLSDAMSVLVEHVRPSKDQYPTIYIFHCPMTKGDWLQTDRDMANPFYGFKMLKCGKQTGVK